MQKQHIQNFLIEFQKYDQSTPVSNQSNRGLRLQRGEEEISS